MLRTARIAPLLVAATLLVAGCGDTNNTTDTPPEPTSASSSAVTSTESPADEPSETTTSNGPTLNVTVDGDDIGPNSDRIELGVGEPLTVKFTADRAGELHVHARPEQTLRFVEGVSSAELVIDSPGVVEIEDHGTGRVLAQLEVR